MMSTIYTDRDGDEWKKSCFGCYKNVNKGAINSTFCNALGEYLHDNGQFNDFYKQSPNSCPSFGPRAS